MRADVERMELAQATVDLRQAVTHFSWLKFILPGFGGMRVGKGSKASFINAGTVGALLKQYPFISSIVSLLLAKPLRATVVAGAKPALKWGSLGLAGVGSVSDLAADEARFASAVCATKAESTNSGY